MTPARFKGNPCPRCGCLTRYRSNRRCVRCDFKRVNLITYRKRMTEGSPQREKWLKTKKLSHTRFAQKPGAVRRKAAAYRASQRVRLFSLYGGCCKLCSYKDQEALVLDHVKGDGGWKQKGALTTHQVYSLAINTPDATKFRILCHNCNFKAHLWRIRTGRIRRTPWRKTT